MAALVVQSRFAGLKIEDDDLPSTVAQNTDKQKKTNTSTAKKSEPLKKNKSNTKVQPAPKKKKSKANAPTVQQWEQWRQKDEELVDGNFEDELQQAILLSKLDYEEKKDVYKQIKKDAETEKKLAEQASKAGSKKQKKKNIMSLDQFNDMMNSNEDCKYNQEKEKSSTEHAKSPSKEKDEEFFDRIKEDTKNELLRDKIIDRVKNRKNLPEEIMSRVQFADALERKEEEIAALKEEIVGLKEELHTVKTRNKKLCNILGQGEMKDKAQVLMEVERLRCVQAELNAELASLHSDLEKERSKNTNDLRSKDKKHLTKKKGIRFDVSSEAIMSKESSSGTA